MSFFTKEKEVVRHGSKSTEQYLCVGRIVALAIACIFVLLLAIMCIAIVGTGKVAVVTRFGNVVGMESQGFHIKTPIDTYNIVDVTQQQITDNYSTASKDNQSIDQEITAQIVVDPENAENLYTKFLGNHMDGIVRPVLSDGFKAATAKYSLEDTIEKRDQLSVDMLTAVQERLASYGINVVSVEINNVELPEEYKAAVERQKVAERDQVTAQVEQQTAEIDAETNRIIADSLDSRNFQKMFIEKWDGVLPLYMGGDGSLDMLLPSGQ